MEPITTEAEWLACVEPLQLRRYAAGRVGTQRFRWLAADWGGRVRHLMYDYDVPWFDAFAAWVAGAGDHPREVCQVPLFVYMEQLRPAASSARWCAEAVRDDDPMRAAAYAGESAADDYPLTPLPPPDPAHTHRGRAAAKRAADRALSESHRNEWWAAREAHAVRVAREFCDQFRDVAGNPFRPVVFDPAWLTSDVRGLVQAVDALRAFDRLPILADALEDAGCNSDDVLTHCRRPGPHVRGCWVIDGLLGRA